MNNLVSLIVGCIEQGIEQGADPDLLEVRSDPGMRDKIATEYGLPTGCDALTLHWLGHEIPVIADPYCPRDRIYVLSRRMCNRCGEPMPFNPMTYVGLCDKCIAAELRAHNRHAWVLTARPGAGTLMAR